MVVSVVMQIGRTRIAPASTSASSNGISIRSWFTVSTYKIPLFTTVPTSIRKPSMEFILIGQSARNRNPKEPIKLNGIVAITIRENFGDSNWIAMTMKIRKIAVTSAIPNAESSSPIDSSRLLVAISTPYGNSQFCTKLLTSFSAVFL